MTKDHQPAAPKGIPERRSARPNAAPLTTTTARECRMCATSGRVHVFALPELLDRLDRAEPAFEHFFRAERLSLTVASWPEASIDDQQRHVEDEVYLVAAGTALLRVSDEDRSVRPGSVVYVAAGVVHHFHSITEHLQVLVFWSPPRAVSPG